MRAPLASFVFAATALVSPAIVSAQKVAPSSDKPPATAKKPHVVKVLGNTRPDDYFWLRDKNNPEVRKNLEAENAYTAQMTKGTEKLQQTLFDEMVKRTKLSDETASYRDGKWAYRTRTLEGKQYPVYLRKPAAGGADQVVLDLNAMAAGHGFFALGTWNVSDDGNLVAYTVDTTGYRQYELHVKDLRTGKVLSDRVPRVGSVEWASDNHTLFITTEDSVTKRSDKFWRHKVGTDSTTLLYNEKDELYDVSAYRSRDKKMVMLQAAAKTMTETRYVMANDPNGALKIVLPRQKDHEYYVDQDEGKFLIRTNRGAQNFKIVSAPIATPDEKHWTPLIPHNPSVKIESIDCFARNYVISERENGLTYLRVIDKKSNASHRIETTEPVYTLDMSVNAEYDVDSVHFSYNSLVTPPSTFAYEMKSKKRTLLKQQEVIGYDKSKYESKRIWVVARDGTKVPVALVYAKGTPMDGSAPMLLYGYGSYGVSFDPSFSAPRVSLLDRGFIYALASIRGGGELGEPWREAGRMMKKMNTFTDFIDVAEYLEKNKFTSADRMMIQGASAGGLLMGAVTNMRPDLFKVVDAQVPFVDVVNTMLDASLPLTTSEYIEWGNPNEKPAYDYMMKYSPYDNVKKQAYPTMLVEISYNDSQVPYWEGMKFAAKIREMKTDKNPLLVKANMGAGHGGASGRYDRWHEIAFDYAFMISQQPLGKIVN